jgi:hypothetical protein
MSAAQEHSLKLRVRAKKFMETVTNTGKSRLVAAPWANNTVRVNGKTYGPGDTFHVEPIKDEMGKVIRTAKQMAEDLLSTGGVERADGKPTPFTPPSLEHKITLTNGIVYRDDIDGKIPTRRGPTDINAPWEGNDNDFDED